MALTEEQLITWSKPVSTTEDQKCKNALTQVTDVLRAKFGNRISIFLQGSYNNNTNVRRDSDVDIVARYNDVFYHDISSLNEQQQIIYNATRIPADYTFSQFKNDVQTALQGAFGSDVERKNKCVLVKGNSYRVNADVVPCFVHKRFSTALTVAAEGIEFFADDGTDIISYPEQHYRNGVIKTENTSRMYKRTVRVLKNIRNKLIEANAIDKNLASSFFIECLVWNVFNQKFISGSYRQTLSNIIVEIYNDMEKMEKSNDYAEVSNLLWLFRGGHRKPEHAKLFMQQCWNYAGFA